ncbi:MAG: bifunctional folylpolyglutamate synthase/dihydrofolate synthase [Muribaculaceae bacterium]|nr:bifunctional folylpolyglutamate synthase/dihydrofolate synthase [Muribaculaceae bacterium]
MTYKESLDFLFSQLPMFSRVGAAAYKPGLDTSVALDNFFGNPHRRFRSIHVGGTNGKGSTSHMLASILQAQGYKVGLYTSPHLADFRERMRINGKMIPEEMVIDFVERWQNCDYDGHPSFFELTMMMAFDWFATENVDYAIIEVGMGGRLDSTNIITPVATVITNISPDHMQFLGDTLEKIAAEKAGIFKKGVPAVIGMAEGGVRRVFEEKGALAGTPLRFACDEPKLINGRLLEDGTLVGDSVLSGPFHSPLGGEYQLENINTVLHAIDTLRMTGVRIEGEAIRDGLEEVVSRTGLMGRWMVTTRLPLTICDTGHNEAGLRHTMHQLQEVWHRKRTEDTDSRLRMVIGFVNDKDVAHIAPLLIKNADYYVTQASVPRAMPASELMAILQPLGLSCRLCPDGVAEAYKSALTDSAPDDVIYVGGSTFIVADYLAALPHKD